VTINGQADFSERETLFRRVLQTFIDTRELTLIVLIAAIIIVMANVNPYF
jgi:ribose transport system permease protein